MEGQWVVPLAELDYLVFADCVVADSPGVTDL